MTRDFSKAAETKAEGQDFFQQEGGREEYLGVILLLPHIIRKLVEQETKGVADFYINAAFTFLYVCVMEGLLPGLIRVVRGGEDHLGGGIQAASLR